MFFHRKEATAVIDRVRQTGIFVGGQTRNMQGKRNTFTIVLEAKDGSLVNCFSHPEVKMLTASEVNRQNQIAENFRRQEAMRAQAIVDANLQEVPAMLDAAAVYAAAQEIVNEKPKRVRKPKVDRTLLPTTSIG